MEVSMSWFLDRIIERAKVDQKIIVLPEGTDPRTLEAAAKIVELGIAKPVVLADADTVAASPFDLSGVEVVDPLNSPDRQRYADELFALRQAKGMTREEAYETTANVLYFGSLMVRLGDADGMVAGAVFSTSDVLRAALQVIKTAPEAALVSAFFVIVVPDCEFGANGGFIFADSGLVQYPSAADLSEIAVSSAASCKSLLEVEPVVALLSHSTLGSAKGESIDRMREALDLAKSKAPELQIDGEFQFDTAIVPSVGASKAPGNAIAGKANVLVFPDLDSGNISYKIAQRLAKAEAFGPITQGLAKPVNDLSRGCSADDIVGVAAITSVQAQG
jgi:phosphate acetyltransferase